MTQLHDTITRTVIATFCTAVIACTAPEPETNAIRAALETENGIDWNGIDWNGINWNGVDWNGIDWNGINWNGVDWNGINWNGINWNGIDWNGFNWNGIASDTVDWTAGAAAVEWNAIDWTAADWNTVPWRDLASSVDWSAVDWDAVQIVDVIGRRDNRVAVHPRARPLFLFVRARSGELEIPLAIPSPGALRMIASAPSRTAALHFLEKSWQIAYGPGAHLLLGRASDGDAPLVVDGRLGLAPSLGGLGPYVEPQVAAWSSMIGNLLNNHPFELSLRAYNVAAMAASGAELEKYSVTDLRGVIGRIVPPPDDPRQEPILVLFRDRSYVQGNTLVGPNVADELDQRQACPLTAFDMWADCGGGITVVNERWAEAEAVGGCDQVVWDGPYRGAVTGQCWIDLPHVTYAQDAAEAPITGSFVNMRTLPCTRCELVSF